MSKHVAFTPAAREELRAASRWYEEQRFGLGRELLAAVREAIQRVRENPAAGARVPQVPRSLPARRVLLRRFPYALVYLERPDETRLLAVAHLHRAPGYWRDRVE